MRVLLIEDDPAHAKLLRKAVTEGLGPTAVAILAPAVNEALGHVASHRFDVAILDLGLRDSHGVPTVRRFRAAAPSIPIIVVTSLADKDIGEECVAAGAQDYITKAELRPDTLRRAVAFARLRHERAREDQERVEHALTNLINAAKAATSGRADPGPGEPDAPLGPLVEAFDQIVTGKQHAEAFIAEDRSADQIEALAASLAGREAGPRTVTRIFTLAVRARLTRGPVEGLEEYHDAGRLVFERLLGELALCYRDGHARAGRHKEAKAT